MVVIDYPGICTQDIGESLAVSGSSGPLANRVDVLRLNVIVSAPLDIPAGSKLGYIGNDDEKMGTLAAAEIARLKHGKGSIAMVGLARFAPGVVLRVRGAERFLASRFPDIRVVSRINGAYNTPEAEGLTNSTVNSGPGWRGGN